MRRDAKPNRGGRNESTVSSPGLPAIKFHSILTDLIAQSPYNTNRRPIWEHAQISSAALSQYVLGRARPRYETLVLLSDFFGVSLDYLLLGDQVATSSLTNESHSVARYDAAMADIQARMGAHAWLTTRIGHAVAARIDAVAKELLPDVPRVGGLITDDEALRLERLSLYCKIVTINLDHDLLEDADGIVGGRFARVVAENLMKSPGCTYEVLLPRRADLSWSDVVHTYRRVLSDMGVTPQRLKQYRFLLTTDRVFSGGCFYQLDQVRLPREEPVLYEAIRPYLSERGWIGFTLHQNNEVLGGLLHDPPNLERALEVFDGLWQEGETISSVALGS